MRHIGPRSTLTILFISIGLVVLTPAVSAQTANAGLLLTSKTATPTIPKAPDQPLLPNDILFIPDSTGKRVALRMSFLVLRQS